MPRPDITWLGQVETFVASAARTASGTSAPAAGYGYAQRLRAQLEITVVTGVAPTLDVVIEDSLDGINWNTIGTFTQKTAESREVINVTNPFADLLRVRWTTGGTSPSFTFSVIALSE